MSTPNNPPVSSSVSAAALAWPAALALAAAMGIGRFAFTPVWPLMAQESGLTLAQGSWLASANYAGYLLGALAAIVWPVRRLRGTLAASLAAVALLTLAMPFGHGLAVWCVLRLAAGYASASAFICVAAWRPVPAGDAREANVSAITYAGVGAGIALTGLACLALAAYGTSANTQWIALGGLAAVLSAAAWVKLRRQAAPAPVHAAAALAGNLPTGMRRLALHYGIFGMGYIIPATFLPAMAKEIIPDPAIFGWAWPLFGLAAALSCLLVPRLGRGRDHRQVWRGAQALMALGMLAARRGAGAAAPRAAAIMTAAFATGQILGPLLASWAARWGAGLPQVLAASAVLLAFSAWQLGKTDRLGAGHNAVGPQG